jgi:uncharacterized protein (DUF1697 family)
MKPPRKPQEHAGPGTRYVAFLRGINLGRRRVPMARLKALVEELGFRDVRTFIASGNVVFTAPAGEAGALADRIGAHLGARLGFPVDTFVRPFDAVAALAEATVFPETGNAGITIHVGFLREPLPPAAARVLGSVRTETDELRVRGAEYHWLCRIRTPDSKVWSLPQVRALRLPSSTMRNLTSLRKLVAQFRA